MLCLSSKSSEKFNKILYYITIFRKILRTYSSPALPKPKKEYPIMTKAPQS